MISKFLENEGFVEVETPILSKKAIPESSIRLFETKRTTMNGQDEFYLLPSPELYMKRMIFEWRKSIYQFSKCFRNSEQTSKEHCNEFTMLEYYKIGENEQDQARRTDKMLKEISAELNCSCKLDGFRYMSMREAVKSIVGLDLDEMQNKESLLKNLESIGISVYDKSESWADSFNRLFVSAIEPNLPCQDKPLLLYDYPRQIECLAADKDDKYKRRWELYYKGIELANCYYEAVKKEDIAKCFENEIKTVKSIEPGFRQDDDMVSYAPLPPSSGVALGFDRLVMLLTDKDNIRNVLPFYENLI